MISKSQPARTGTPQVQSIIITAIILFAFSGLMVGFTVGALTRPAKSSTNNTNSANSATNRATPTPTSTPPPTVTTFIRMGSPELQLSNPTLNPDGTPTYSVKIQAKDSVDSKKSITADDITCRLWLVPQGDDPEKAPGTHFLKTAEDQLQQVAKLNQSFPQEIENALVFDPTTPSKVQPCVKGNATWKFTISPSVPKDEYFLVGLTNWQGKSYNWTWVQIIVGNKKQ